MSRKGGNTKRDRKSSGRVKTEEEEEEWQEAESEDVSASANITQDSAANATAGGGADDDGEELVVDNNPTNPLLTSPPVRDSQSRLSSERSGEFETENLARSSESIPRTPSTSELHGSTDNLLKIRIPFSKLKGSNAQFPSTPPVRVTVRYAMPQGERSGQLRLDLPDTLASGGSPLLTKTLATFRGDMASIPRRDVDPLREELYQTRRQLQGYMDELCTELELLHQWKVQDPNAPFTRPVAPSLELEPVQTPKQRRTRDGLDFDESPYSPRPKGGSQSKVGGGATAGSKLGGAVDVSGKEKKRNRSFRNADQLMDSELEDEIDVLESEASGPGSPRPKPKQKLFGAAAASAAASAAAAAGTSGAGRPPKPKSSNALASSSAGLGDDSSSTPRPALPKRNRKKSGAALLDDDDDVAASLLEDEESVTSAAAGGAGGGSAAAAATAAAEEVLYTHPLDPHSFWTLLMPWLRDMTDADIQLVSQKVLRPDDPLLTIPPLGRPHAEHPTSVLVKGARGSAAFGSDEDHMDVNGDQPVFIGDFTSRLLQALVEEKLIPGAENAASTTAGSTSTGSAAVSAADFEFGEEVALPLHSAPQWDYSYTGMLAIEERIKSDLKSLGLFDDSPLANEKDEKKDGNALASGSSSSAAGPPPADQNDEICAELRSLHAKLREKNASLNAIRAKILPLCEPKVAEYKQMRKEREPLENDEQIYIRDFKKKPKSRKQKGSKKDKDR